jgi:hypothetical protein
MEEFFIQVEEIRTNVENIQKYVNEVKKLHSTILAAPTTDDSSQYFYFIFSFRQKSKDVIYLKRLNKVFGS